MAKSKVVLTSRFPAAEKGMHDAVRYARDNALNEGENAGEEAIDRANNSRGYNLPSDITQKKTGFQSGEIRYPQFFGKFFEYGTVYIAPTPFMRPAHRKMRRQFLKDMDATAELWIRRRVGKL